MFSIPDGIESKFRYAKSNDDRNADNQSNVILSQNVNSNPYQDNRQTNDSDTTEDPDQQSLANQMRAFQKSMLENRRTFQVTMTDTITEKMTLPLMICREDSHSQEDRNCRVVLRPL